MKSIVKQSGKRAGYTIIELLTVMSIIVILMGLLVPALQRVRRYAKTVKQKAQFHSIGVALDLFNAQFDGYPPSDAKDQAGVNYCGAMKLCEAMMGQDLLGFHPDSIFRSDGMDRAGASPPAVDLYPAVATKDNLQARRGPYLPLENANAYLLKDLYDSSMISNAGFDQDKDHYVLCDVFSRVTNKTTGKKVGMPILYYLANTSKNSHDVTDPLNPDNIYDYRDNHNLVGMGMPWDKTGTAVHPLYKVNNDPDGQRFYELTKNDKISLATGRPYRSDSYILISAGYDGEYGTADDVFNFER